MSFPKTMWVFCLPERIKQEIWDALCEDGVSFKDRVRGMDGRLCDLEDTIDIRRYTE